MEIKKLEKKEINKALKLVWDVFLECEAFNYNRRGVEEFRRFLDCRELINEFDFYGTVLVAVSYTHLRAHET